ncbi:MAG: MFS transporter [Rhizobiales bacterium]|nr:MFS transporter [Hyphomicrobiales bacterium]
MTNINIDSSDFTDSSSAQRKAGHRKYLQLLALFGAYILSNVFRTLPAIMAPDITEEFSLSLQSAGYFLVAFNLAFGGMQLFVGVAIDRFQPMRTVAVLLACTGAGSMISVIAPNFMTLVVCQILIGVGCSAIFLATLVFISSHFASTKFARLSGLALGLGGIGMMLTASPLALIVDAWSWRGAFVVISLLALILTAVCFLLRDERASATRPSETLIESFSLLVLLLRRRGTLGILFMGAVGYAAMIAVRGFWIVPLLTKRHGLSLVDSAHVVLLLSVGMTLSPLIYGWVDPGDVRRRRLILVSALTMAIAIFALGSELSESFPATIIAIVAIGAVSGFTILQYADVRYSFEPQVIGRALSLLNMSVFLGAAIVQMLCGFVSGFAMSLNTDPLSLAFLTLGLTVTGGCIAFALLPSPRRSATRTMTRDGT